MPGRITTPNPNGRGYRIPCAVNTEDLKVDYTMKYPTLCGNKINILGKLEDYIYPKSLEDLLKELKK